MGRNRTDNQQTSRGQHAIFATVGITAQNHVILILAQKMKKIGNQAKIFVGNKSKIRIFETL